MEPNEIIKPQTKLPRKFFILGVAIFIIFCAHFIFPPKNFPTGTIVTISRGEPLVKISRDFESLGLVRSKLIFQTVAVVLGGAHNISPGDYLFERKVSGIEVARRIAFGVHHIAPSKITLPEGKNNTEMAEIFAEKIPLFDKNLFLAQAISKQGYLFPDTYFFYPHTTISEIVETLNKNFEKHIAKFKKEITESKRTEAQIVIMASILEREASGENDMATIAGILWKRYDIGMKLQVDATNGMVFDTYKSVGLPESPIGNPGILSIKSAIHPTPSNYLYYLHDKNGAVHYAATYAEHKRNIAKYLR